MTRIRVGKKESTKKEVDARDINGVGVEIYGNECLAYFLMQSDNITVPSEATVKTEIIAMSSVIEGLNPIELSCISSREGFDRNRILCKERLEEGGSPGVREILEKDLIHLDRIWVQMASAKEFLLILRFHNYNPEASEVQTGISRMARLLKDVGFSCCRASKGDIKRPYAVYFIQNITQAYFDDYDDERFVKKDKYR